MTGLLGPGGDAVNSSSPVPGPVAMLQSPATVAVMTGRDPVDAAPPETLGPDRKWEGAARADQAGHDFGGRGAASPPSHPALPRFPVALVPPDLDPFLAGNTGIPGFTTMVGARPGPHVLLIALMHGNEISGAIVLDALLREARGLVPAAKTPPWVQVRLSRSGMR